MAKVLSAIEQLAQLYTIKNEAQVKAFLTSEMITALLQGADEIANFFPDAALVLDVLIPSPEKSCANAVGTHYRKTELAPTIFRTVLKRTWYNLCGPTGLQKVGHIYYSC
jgi:hypothetical protein